MKMTQKWRNRLNWLRCGERSWSGSKKELRCSDDGMHAFSSPSLSEKERRVFFLCYKVGFLSNRVRPEPFAEKKCLRYGRFPLSRHTIIYRRRRLCQLGPAVKRESIDSMMNNAVDGFFFCGSAKRASGVREKKWGKRAGGGASCAPHRREGTESGVAWNEKERRCVVEARGRVEKARGESKRRAGESENKGCAIEKQGIAESKRRGRNPKECEARNPKAHGTRNQKACNLPTTL